MQFVLNNILLKNLNILYLTKNIEQEKNIYLLGNSMDINMIFALCSAMQKQKFIKDQKQLMPTGALSMVLSFLTKQFR